MFTTKRILTFPLAIALVATLALGTLGCQTMRENPKTSGAILGGLVGAGTGAAVGGHENRAAGVAIGAAAGAALGAGAGWAYDKWANRYEEIDDVEVITEEGSGAGESPRIQLRMGSELLFDQGSSTLTPAGRQKLAEVASVMREDTSSRAIVKGYTSSEGASNYNQTLSENRAKVVANTLIANKVDPTRIQAVGLGESNPIASNETESGRAMNRRVEIEIFPASEVR